MINSPKKRFWESAEVLQLGAEYSVVLDGRNIKTPGKSEFRLPTLALAEAVAFEWDQQAELIKPETMPFTRSANSAIDKVAPQHSGVVQLISEYGGTDLLCYRADNPEELIARQSAAWDPILAWSKQSMGAHLKPVSGVMFEQQPPESLAALEGRVAELSVFELTGFYDLVSITGSLVLAFAAIDGFLAPKEIWKAARIDEDWQNEQWGVDDEAHENVQKKLGAFLHAELFYRLSKV